MNTNHSKSVESSIEAGVKVSGKRDEITKLRCATDSTPWEHPIDEFAAWMDEQISGLEVRFAKYSTVSGRRKSFSR